MDRFRDWLVKNPWAGWVLAGLILVSAVGLYFFRTSGSGDTYSPDSMREELTVRFTDIGDTMKIPRGRLDRMLRDRKTFDPAEGITNPATGKPTGFLVDEDEWNGMLNRIKTERAAFQSGEAGGSPLGGRPAQPPPK
jgi:hypothetical protein